ncbi:G5 domain-containing protein [uncultured Streptococcus sp.]|uniref:G5 domain-containing protein n=1 Tax=uncultured Streptococcus sp. TaxID=83427 RepID=UPI0028D73AD9|nr:YSIRK-type signal peptide-containing protein [uncultured Streptococcus sp.]
MKDIFNKRQRFSIRKFSVGVASVLIGVSLFAPIQGVLASTENNLVTEIGANSERESSIPTVEKKEENQNSPENQGAISSPAPKDTPIGSTRTTELETSGNKENNSLTTRAFVAGEDRSSTSAVRAASNPSEIKKYELTKEDAKKIKAGVIGSEGNKLDSLLLNGPQLSPEAYTDDDFLKDKEELYIYEKGGKKYVGYNSHPLLEDTDGDGIIDSDEKIDEKLKWNVSERDMIMFMELSYRDDNYIDRVLDHKKPLTESELYKKNGETRPRYEYMMMNKELAPYWKRKKSYHTSSGLDAVLYETKSDFSYLPNGTAQVLAFRGTSDAKDIGADITLGTGSNPQQGIDAENIMRELAKDKSITNLYLTGHSLGGYLVQRAMVEAYQLAYSDSRVMSSKDQRAYRNFYNNVLKKGTTFNAPKVRTGLFSSSAFWQKGLDSKNIAKSGKMTHYIVNNDSTIRKSVSNDSDVVINVGNTKGGHSSRSYFEADMINRRPEFISGKRISLDGIGFQNPKITTAKSLEKVGETVVYSKRGNDIIKLTTVSIKDPDTGNITKNTTDEIFKKDGAKDKVETTAILSPKKYVKDDTREKGQANVEVPGKTGKQTVTTTYSVNPNTGDLTEHVGQPVVKQPATETVVKVAAKDEVEYIKKGADVVKKTTSYTVNSKTGSLTSAEKEEVVNRGGAKDIVEYNSVEPKPVYLKDENSLKGTVTVQFPGKAGQTKVTTTYSVNPVNGTLTPSKGEPKVVYRPIARVVKVGAKDKVVETPIEPEVEYVRDGEREVDTPNERVEGAKGKTVTTTTYDVDSNDGHITEHVGNPVVSPAGKTIVKVGAKTKVEQSKDSEGRDVIDTTTYEVDPKTGKVTPTTVRTYGKTKEPTVEKRVVPSPVVYEKDDTKEKGTAPTTVKGENGEDTITTTYTVNPNTGKITASEGQPVRTKEPTNTVVKVPAKDKVETTELPSPKRYVKDDTRDKDQPNVEEAGQAGSSTVTTTYEVNPADGTITERVGKPVVVNPTETIVKVAAKDKVETTELPSPKKYVKDDTRDKDQPNVEEAGQAGSSTTTTTYSVDPTTGAITETVGKPVVVNPTETIVKVAAKDKVVETPIEPEVEYVRDGEREVDTPNERVEGAKGKTVTTTTYDVDSNDGHITEHVGNPVVSPAGKTIVKVGAKTKVEQSKDSEGRDVIDTTTYEVDPKTGKVTPTTVRTYGKTKEPTVEKRVVPSPVVYEKDDTKEKGTAPTTVKGENGEDTITTTYTVNPNTGKITASEGQPVRTKEPTNTIVKVAAKDRVEVTEIPSPKKYVKDDTRAKDQPNVEEAGKAGSRTVTTTYEVNPADGTITERVGKPVVVNPTATIVKVAAKDKVETTKIPSPKRYVKDDTRAKDQPNVEEAGKAGSRTTTTTYSVDPTTGAITERVGEPVVVNPTATIVKVAAKDKVVEAPIEPEVEYVRDGEREVDTPNERVEGAKGKTVTTTTYDVDSNDGHITEHVGNPVVSPAGKTIVKVGAKTKVEQSKDSEGRDVIDTTTYEVDPKTGKVTPTTVRTYGKTKEPTVEKRVVPSPVVYEKDDTKEKGTAPTTVKGENGEDTITTTYTVNPNTGKITASEGQPVRTKEPTNTIVKVPAKDKVETTEIPSPKRYVKDDTRDKDQPNVEEAGQAGSSTVTTTYEVNLADGTITERVGKPVVVNPTATIVKVAAKDKVVEAPIEPEVEYVRDGEREVDTPNERVEGAKGKTVTTTTYDVDSNDGHITEHVGNPVVSPAGKTIVKVGAKTKVEQSKDSEGRDVIDTTTYEVDPKTGKVTPTTVRTYGTTKEPKVELEQDPKTGDVTVTPKKPDGSTYPPGTKVEIPGKDGNPIVVTIDEDGKGKVPNSDLPNVEKTGTGKITEPGKSSVEVPKVTTFENDVLSGSIALPEPMIEVRWIDEDGNVLKPSVKTGNEKDAEHGSIPEYEFVRTVIDENEPVITHIFRKVSGTTNTNPVAPVTPDTNGSSAQDTPAPITPTPTPIPDVVTPNADQVDTKTTVDNGAKSNDSQNVLPSTGTESNANLASLGLLGMLGGLGLALAKKKED